MKFELIKIGNSKGIRIPSNIIEACGFNDFIDVQIEDSKLILSPGKSCRVGWSESFKQMGKEGDDLPVDDVFIESEWDKEEWTW